VRRPPLNGDTFIGIFRLRGTDPPMTSHRLLTLSPDHEPLWVRLFVHQIGEKWAAARVADGVPPSEPIRLGAGWGRKGPQPSAVKDDDAGIAACLRRRGEGPCRSRSSLLSLKIG
jgi:hypothetical protein